MKISGVSDFTRFSFYRSISHFNPSKLQNYPLRGRSLMPRNLSYDKDIIGSRALHLGMWYGHSKSWNVFLNITLIVYLCELLSDFQNSSLFRKLIKIHIDQNHGHIAANSAP